MLPISIAIDGPAGAGKSTVARKAASRLGFLYVDTGAMYRAVSFLCVKDDVPSDNEELVNLALGRHHIAFVQASDSLRIVIDGTDITDQLRSPEVSAHVSAVAAHESIRSQMTQWQRSFAVEHSVVMDGRDIGTVVLPNATVKVFLTADVRARAERRREEYRRKGYEVPLDEILSAMAERDRKDSQRSIAPLVQAADATVIDTTGKTVDAVVDEILSMVRERQ